MDGGTPRRQPATIEEFAATITSTLRTGLLREGVETEGIRLQVEPGRSMYGDTGIHLTRVKKVKAGLLDRPDGDLCGVTDRPQAAYRWGTVYSTGEVGGGGPAQRS